MCKTLFGDEGELIVEELFKLGQCSMSTVLFRSARRLKLAKKDETDFSVKILITSLRKKFTELVDCQFLCRVPRYPPYIVKAHFLFICVHFWQFLKSPPGPPN